MNKIVVVGALGLFMGGCIAAHQDDGFRARVASGCSTSEDCAVLEREASARYVECQKNSNGQHCKAELEDREQARRLQKEQRRRDQAASDDRVRARHAQIKTTGDEQQRIHNVVRSMTGRCGDAETAERAIREMPSDIDAAERERLTSKLRAAVDARRAERFETVSEVLAAEKRRGTHLADMADPSRGLEPVTRLRGLIAELQCGAEKPNEAQLRADVELWTAQREKDVADEAKCRETPACMGERLVNPLCQLIEERKGFIADMAKERANPSGYVNKTYLHELGATIQDHEERIARAKKEYAQITRKNFSEAQCTAPRPR